MGSMRFLRRRRPQLAANTFCCRWSARTPCIERVYYYELYHQMRRRWPEPDHSPYWLNGEIDKAVILISGASAASVSPTCLSMCQGA
jgi:hypothetical protein